MPYIKEGYPGNLTVLVNDTVRLSCPPISDLEPMVYWLRSPNETLLDDEGRPLYKTRDNIERLEVHIPNLVME
jgi:hypothetical protein